MNSWQAWFSDRLEFSAFMDDEAWGQLPAARGLVLLTDEEERPIQLLTAADMRRRVRNRLEQPNSHEPTRRINLREIVRRAWWVRLGSRFETDWLYLQIASELWPKRFAKMVSWKSPWFVHLDIQATYPHFSRTRDVGGRQGSFLGPFPSGRDADKFITCLQEAFYLCRSVNCLRRTPNGPQCTYAQMNVCVSPADGTISMEAYRKILQSALDAAEGRRNEVKAEWLRAMRQASEKLEFEHAAAWKKRLKRLDDLETPAFLQVRLLSEFSFLIFQPGVGKRQRCLFWANCGKIERLGILDWPTDAKKMTELLSKIPCRRHDSMNGIDELGRLQMGLVCRELFSESKQRGLILPSCEEQKDASEELLAALEQWENQNQTVLLKKSCEEEEEMESPQG